MLRGLLARPVFALALATSSAVHAQPETQAGRAREAWKALEAGRPREAAATFDEALRLGRPTSDLLLGSALAAHLLGRYEDARRHLLDALDGNPELTAASLLLGDVLYRTGDVRGAVDVYTRALASAPEDALIAARIEAWQKELALHDQFDQRLGNHFTVLFEGPAEATLAARALEILDTAYWRIGTILFTYPAQPITVILYTGEQFRDVTQSPDWAGGAFDGRIRVPVRGALDNPAEFERVLTHEFTHALVHSLAPRGVPLWFDEGLAVYFEGSDPAARREFVRQTKRPMPLRRLERSFSGLSAADAELAYAQSAVAVQTLVDQNGPTTVVNLLTDVGRGMPFAEAFERHMLISYEAFQKQVLGAGDDPEHPQW